jgi:hypothetical protein
LSEVRLAVRARTSRACKGTRTALLLALTLSLGDLGSGCKAGCTRTISLEAARAADDYVNAAVDIQLRLRDAKVPPYGAALATLRRLTETKDVAGWRAFSTRDRTLALSGLIVAERDHPEETMLAALLAKGGVDPFVPDAYGMVPFALAMRADAEVARALAPLLATHPKTRPSAEVLCGLHRYSVPEIRSIIRAYCPCEK